MHGREETARAERAARALYTEEIATLDADLLADVVADAPSSVLARTTLEGDGLDLTDGLVASGLCSSKSEARRVISQGGAYVDNVRRGGGEIIGSAAAITRADLLADRYVLLRRGKQDYHVLIFE